MEQLLHIFYEFFDKKIILDNIVVFLIIAADVSSQDDSIPRIIGFFSLKFNIYYILYKIFHIMKNETKLIHSVPSDSLTGAISPPIYQTSTYVQKSPGIHKGFDYTRTNNPTRKILENTITCLESGYSGFAFSSGMAAIDAVLKLLNCGDEIIAVDDIYGGAYRILTTLYNRFGFKIKFIDTSKSENIQHAISNKTKMVWLESPTNPTLKISDIKSISKIVKKNKLLLVVDNTFASPVIQNPLNLGANIVVHSATKYLAGHSDVLAGLVVVNCYDLSEKIKHIQNTSGSILSPFDSWLTLRGMQTLFLRVKKQSLNAFKLANFIKKINYIDKIYYPGLKTHKNYNIAVLQQKYFGSIISFSLKKDNKDNAIKFVSSTKIFKLAESLGGTKSLICHPASMTHKSIPEKIRKSTGIQDSLIRLSCGVEHIDDLIQDINNAFKKI